MSFCFFFNPIFIRKCQKIKRVTFFDSQDEINARENLYRYKCTNTWKIFSESEYLEALFTAGQQIKMESSSTYSKHLQTKASWSHNGSHIFKLSDTICQQLTSFMIINAFLFGCWTLNIKSTHSFRRYSRQILKTKLLNSKYHVSFLLNKCS